MNTIKSILVFLVATASLAFLLTRLAINFGPRSLFFAFLGNWLVVSWVALVGQAITFQLPENYHRINPWERDGSVYLKLGVRFFKKLVRRGPLTVFSPTLRFSGREVDLPALQIEMRKAEAGHLVAFGLVTVLAFYELVQSWWDGAAYLMLFNLPLNLYPVFLQRYNRARFEKVARQPAQAQYSGL